MLDRARPILVVREDAPVRKSYHNLDRGSRRAHALQEVALTLEQAAGHLLKRGETARSSALARSDVLSACRVNFDTAHRLSRRGIQVRGLSQWSLEVLGLARRGVSLIRCRHGKPHRR